MAWASLKAAAQPWALLDSGCSQVTLGPSSKQDSISWIPSAPPSVKLSQIHASRQITFEERPFKSKLKLGVQELEAQLKLVFPDLLFTCAQLEPQSLHYSNMEILISSFARLL